MPEPSTELSESLVTLAKRETIAQALLEGKSFSEIKAILKNPATGEEMRQIAQTLSQGETFVSEESHRMIENIYKEIIEEFPNIGGLGLVLIGSSIHGGELARKAFGTQEKQDLDIAYVLDYDNVSFLEITRVQAFVENKLQNKYDKKLHATRIYTNNLIH